MNGSATLEDDSARGASNLLRAMENCSLDELESELDRVAGYCFSVPSLPSHRAEQMDLLGAVAEQMRTSLVRMRRGLSDRLEGAEVHLSLLRHLARDQDGPPALGYSRGSE